MQQIHEILFSKIITSSNRLCALTGLGGSGKTQIALEYAYRHSHDYTAIFWIRAETKESLFSDFMMLAHLLRLPEEQESDQNCLAAVQRWLSNHREWLLIFDNVEDIEQLKVILPAVRSGAILLTMQRQDIDIATSIINLCNMDIEEGKQFLLHRTRLCNIGEISTCDAQDEFVASQIVEAMDGLPLALDQAGAYIEATQCNLFDYLCHFQSSQLRLLEERTSHTYHPFSVTKTFLMAFERVQQSSPLAAELLTICTFLAPKPIPEEFFTKNTIWLGPAFVQLTEDPLRFDATIKELLVHSLLQRNIASRTVTVHCLLQAVLKGCLSEVTQRIWVARIIQAMSQLFPSEQTQPDYWQLCKLLLPHALMCVTLGEQWGDNIVECITLMSHVTTYLSHLARFSERDCQFSLI